jgi:hypothetical protein
VTWEDAIGFCRSWGYCDICGSCDQCGFRSSAGPASPPRWAPDRVAGRRHGHRHFPSSDGSVGGATCSPGAESIVDHGHGRPGRSHRGELRRGADRQRSDSLHQELTIGIRQNRDAEQDQRPDPSGTALSKHVSMARRPRRNSLPSSQGVGRDARRLGRLGRLGSACARSQCRA